MKSSLVLETLIFNFYRLERLALVEQFLDSKDVYSLHSGYDLIGSG